MFGREQIIAIIGVVALGLLVLQVFYFCFARRSGKDLWAKSS
jgi:hypothetical protein